MRKLVSLILVILLYFFSGCKPPPYYRLVVREGDTLAKISERVGLDEEEREKFAKFNDLSDDEELKKGVRVSIPEEILSEEWRGIFKDYGLARAYSAKGNFVRAEEIYKQIMIKGMLLPEMEYDLALLLLNQDRINEATGHLISLREIFPEDVDIIYTLGLSYYKLGFLSQSEKVLSKGLTYDEVGKVYYALALIQMDMERYDKAYDNLNIAIEMSLSDQLLKRANNYREIIEEKLELNE